MNKITIQSDKARSFSAELNSKQNLKNVSFTDDQAQNVLIEGTLGELKTAQFVSENILEVVGSEGTLTINIAKNEISEVKHP